MFIAESVVSFSITGGRGFLHVRRALCQERETVLVI